MAQRDETYLRTEQPTIKRRHDARQRGQVAKSADLTASLLILAGVGMLGILSGELLDGFRQLTSSSLQGGRITNTDALFATFANNIWGVAGPAVLIAVVVMVAAVFSNLVQFGFLFATQTVQFDLERVSMSEGFRRIFSLKSFIRLAMAVAKVVAVAIIGFLTIRSGFGRMMQTSSMSASEIMSAAGELIFSFALALAVVFLVLAILDFIFQRWQYEQDLMMTRQELLEELKKSGPGRHVRPGHKGIAVSPSQNSGVNDGK